MTLRIGVIVLVLFDGAFGVASAALKTTVIAQSGAPVQIASCSVGSVLSDEITGMRDYSAISTGRTNESGIVQLNQQGEPRGFPTDEYGTRAAYYGAVAFAGLSAANLSAKAIKGVIFEFRVLDAKHKTVGSFYGRQTGLYRPGAAFSQKPRGPDFGWRGYVSPYFVSAACLVDFVLYADGTSWRSPLSTLPSR